MNLEEQHQFLEHLQALIIRYALDAQREATDNFISKLKDRFRKIHEGIDIAERIQKGEGK